ncbi:MAG: hypothetical protein PWQ23_119 [Thermoanaerobacter sp.]|jgi:formylmethanofuran dehydrogenase subunit E|nr:hypothetical protein [Thermoanaerobacter sp.]
MITHYNVTEYWLTSGHEPQRKSKILGKCKYCGEEIYNDSEYVEYEGNLYCDTYCLAKGIGAKIVW